MVSNSVDVVTLSIRGRYVHCWAVATLVITYTRHTSPPTLPTYTPLTVSYQHITNIMQPATIRKGTF